MIYEQVLSFIHRPEPDRFEHLAIDVFRHQFHAVAAYRGYCLARGVGAESVRCLDDIPAVSTVAFKFAELAGEESLHSPTTVVFQTSGTTKGRARRGRHFVPRHEVYHASAITHLRAMLFPDGCTMRMLTMHPTAHVMPESSLSRMITWAIEEFGRGPNLCAADREGVDVGAAMRFLGEAEAAAAPACIFGTTAALAKLFQGLRESGKVVRLARPSRLMDTGGAKGQTSPLDAPEVVALAAALLGIDPDLVVNEYGMTELCSQLYDATPFNSRLHAPRNPRVKVAPPWLYARAIDPVSLERVEDGRPGLLAFFDLANVGSVSAVMTEDFGIVSNDGVQILGRASAAEARGCALAIGQFAGGR